MCSTLLSRSFSRDFSLLVKDFLPCNVKLFSAPTICNPLLLELKMFRGHKLPRTHCRLVGGVLFVERKVILLTDAPTHVLALISQLQLHPPLPMEPTPFLLLPSRTTLEEESTMSLWRNHRKAQMLSLVSFLSMQLLQLCYLIMEHCILSYLLHMLKNIIYP
jgi:hypothetical protein